AAPTAAGQRLLVGGGLRPVFSCRSSIFFDASAFVMSSLTCSRASSASVCRYERCAPVIGSSPVVQSSGSFFRLDPSSSCVRRSTIVPPTVPRFSLGRTHTSQLAYLRFTFSAGRGGVMYRGIQLRRESDCQKRALMIADDSHDWARAGR